MFQLRGFWARRLPAQLHPLRRDGQHMIQDSELDSRLFMAREETLFREHLKAVFGDRHTTFSAGLQDMLRLLWRRGRDAPKSEDASRKSRRMP